MNPFVFHSFFSLAAHALRSASLARDRRDITVPAGVAVTAIPAGTVMSRLSRARLALRKAWADNEKKL